MSSKIYDMMEYRLQAVEKARAACEGIPTAPPDTEPGTEGAEQALYEARMALREIADDLFFWARKSPACHEMIIIGQNLVFIAEAGIGGAVAKNAEVKK